MNLKDKIKNNQIWTFSTYFAQGFPYSVVRTVFPLFLRDIKVSLESIGLTALFGLPWVLKFLWAPILDKSLSKKKWLTLTQFIIGFLVLCSSFLIKLQDAPFLIALVFFIVAVFSATNDIAIDAYYLAVLDKDEQAKFLGFRVMAYRIAMITGTGLIVTVGTSYSWFLAFILAGAIMLLIASFHLLFLKDSETDQKLFIFKNFLKIKTILVFLIISTLIISIRYFSESSFFTNLKIHNAFLKYFNFSNLISIILLLSLGTLYFFRKKINNFLKNNSDSYYSRAFFTFIDRKDISIVLLFIITLRTGEWMLSTMFSPFIVDLGIKVHYGWLASAVALPASIIGAMLGGWAIYKYGLKKVIWPFIAFQNLTNIFYALLAYYLSDYLKLNTGASTPVFIGYFNITLVAVTMAVENFSAGLGTSVLMVYLMKLCLAEYKATHYAIGSGLMSITGIFAGILSGVFAGSMGYAWTYLISFFFAIPAMLLIPFLPDFKN